MERREFLAGLLSLAVGGVTLAARRQVVRRRPVRQQIRRPVRRQQIFRHRHAEMPRGSDARDIAALRAGMGDTVPWEQVKRELDL